MPKIVVNFSLQIIKMGRFLKSYSEVLFIYCSWSVSVCCRKPG